MSESKPLDGYRIAGAFFIVCIGLTFIGLAIYAVGTLTKGTEPAENRPTVFYIIDQNGKAHPHDGYLTPDGRLIPVETPKPQQQPSIIINNPPRRSPLGNQDTGSKGAAEPQSK